MTTAKRRIVPCVPHRVTRVQDATGSHIEPPLNPDAPELDRLCWLAAVTELDSRVPVRVAHLRDTQSPVKYFVTVGRSGGGAMSFGQAWLWMSGAGIGAQEARRGAPERAA